MKTNLSFPFLFLFVLTTTAVGPCQGVQFGGSLPLGAGAGAGSDDDESDLGTDTTNFRPTSLPPAVDDPGLNITASLTINGGSISESAPPVLALQMGFATIGSATLTGQVTSLNDGAVVAGQALTVVHTRGGSTTIETLPATSDASGNFSVTTSGVFQDGDQLWAAASDTTNGGSNTLVIETRPSVVSVKKSDGTALQNSDTVTSMDFDIKWSATLDESTVNGTNITLVCDGSTVTISLGGTLPVTDTIDGNEVTVQATSLAQTVSCTLTVSQGIRDLSGNAQANAVVRQFNFVGSGSSGSSGTGSGGSGGSGGSETSNPNLFTEEFTSTTDFSSTWDRFFEFWTVDETNGQLDFSAPAITLTPSPSGTVTAAGFAQTVNPSNLSLALSVDSIAAMDSGSADSYLIDGVWVFLGEKASTLEDILDNHIAVGWTFDPTGGGTTCFARRVVDGQSDGLIDVQTEEGTGLCAGVSSLTVRITNNVTSYRLAVSTDGANFTTIDDFPFNATDSNGDGSVGVYFSTSNSTGTFRASLGSIISR